MFNYPFFLSFICLFLCSFMRSFVHTGCMCLRKKMSHAGPLEDKTALRVVVIIIIIIIIIICCKHPAQTQYENMPIQIY